MSEPYLVYTILNPRPEDAPNLRRMWAIVRRQGGRLYEFRRRLAHDYWLARCARIGSNDERSKTMVEN